MMIRDGKVIIGKIMNNEQLIKDVIAGKRDDAARWLANESEQIKSLPSKVKSDILKVRKQLAKTYGNDFYETFKGMQQKEIIKAMSALARKHGLLFSRVQGAFQEL
jgi:hypothetical protein